MSVDCKALQDDGWRFSNFSHIHSSSIMCLTSLFFGWQSTSRRGCNVSRGISDNGWGEGFITISKDQLVFVGMANPLPVSSLILPAEQQSLQGTNLKKKKTCMKLKEIKSKLFSRL